MPALRESGSNKRNSGIEQKEKFMNRAKQKYKNKYIIEENK